MAFAELGSIQPQDPWAVPNIILYVLLFIQVLKLFRPVLEKFSWGKTFFGALDKGTEFVKEVAPLVFDIVEAANKKGILENTKPVAFLLRLREEAQKQGIVLSPDLEAKAQLIASAKAAKDHLPNVVPLSEILGSSKAENPEAKQIVKDTLDQLLKVAKKDLS
jgi:hypothetical protein